MLPTTSATISASCSGHQSAVSFQPGKRTTGIVFNGVPGTASGTFRCAHAVALGERRAVAVVAVEQLQHAGDLAEPGGALERLVERDRVDQPDAAVERRSACELRCIPSSSTQEKPNAYSS